MYRMACVIAACSLLAPCAAAQAAAPYVTATYAPVIGGYVLQYVVHNSLTQDYVYAWAVCTGDAGPAVCPEGWYVWQDWREVHWSTLDPAYDLAPGHDQAGFSYVAASSPGTLGWWVGSRSGYGGAVTPVLVPEPASLVALATGLGTFVLRRKRRG